MAEKILIKKCNLYANDGDASNFSQPWLPRFCKRKSSIHGPGPRLETLFLEPTLPPSTYYLVTFDNKVPKKARKKSSPRRQTERPLSVAADIVTLQTRVVE